MRSPQTTRVRGTRADPQAPRLHSRARGLGTQGSAKPAPPWHRAFVLAALLSCHASTVGPHPQLESKCPLSASDFPPHACAIVTGFARDALGAPLAGYGLRVDSLLPGRGYQYDSNASTVRADGSFRFEVYRISGAIRPAVPDTATVELKLYTDPQPRPRDFSHVQTFPTRMTFAPLGQLVDPTIVDLRYSGPRE